MAKINKKIKNQLLLSLRKNNFINSKTQFAKTDKKTDLINYESTESFFPINHKDLLKVFFNTVLIMLILLGFYYLQQKTNYTTKYTENFRTLIHF